MASFQILSIFLSSFILLLTQYSLSNYHKLQGSKHCAHTFPIFLLIPKQKECFF